jgi:hypothetical protein
MSAYDSDNPKKRSRHLKPLAIHQFAETMVGTLTDLCEQFWQATAKNV